MTITQQKDTDALTLMISGEIDASNVGDFEKAIKAAVDQTQRLVLDLGDLYYVSSAGLRVFLLEQRRIELQKKEMILRNVNDEVMDIFNVTGFADLFHVEK